MDSTDGSLTLRQLVEAVTTEAIWNQEERLRILETRVDSMDVAIQKALEDVFPRVNALLARLDKQTSGPTRGCPLNSESQEADQECVSTRPPADVAGSMASGSAHNSVCPSALVGSLNHLSVHASTHSAVSTSASSACSPSNGLYTSTTCTSTNVTSSLHPNSCLLSNPPVPNSVSSLTSAISSSVASSSVCHPSFSHSSDSTRNSPSTTVSVVCPTSSSIALDHPSSFALGGSCQTTSARTDQVVSSISGLRTLSPSDVLRSSPTSSSRNDLTPAAASSLPYFSNVPNVFGLSCVPSSWQ